jgi:DNA-binding MarR family transcriptional regulator
MNTAPYTTVALFGKLEELLHKAAEREQTMAEYIVNSGEFNDLPRLTLTEFHVIRCIGETKLINASGIYRQMKITRGGISKITMRLRQKKLIETYRQDGNRKEIFYNLTPLGEKAFLLHETVHAAYRTKFNNMIEQQSEKERECIDHFLSELIDII